LKSKKSEFGAVQEEKKNEAISLQMMTASTAAVKNIVQIEND